MALPLPCWTGVHFAIRGPTLNYVCPLSEVAVALQETTAFLPPGCGGRQGAGRLRAPGGSEEETGGT